MNGRYAGKKAIIMRTNYENSKDKKFPHCLVVGLSKTPRRVTKASLKKLEERVKRIETKQNANPEVVSERLARLKRMGVFIKTYNMSHLLATRYKVDDEFGMENHLKSLDKLEDNIKEKQGLLLRKEHEKKDENKPEIEKMKTELGKLRDNYRETVRGAKNSIGTELFSRFVKGFVRTRDNVEENEKIAHSEFLFKKLKF
jgi:hypothetical protein